VSPRLLLGKREAIVDFDLEDPSPGRDEDEVGDVVLELFQQPFRQTDGSRSVASLRAILDRDPHGRRV
jgi:hypothetical protein